jgi:hypothetical protein
MRPRSNFHPFAGLLAATLISACASDVPRHLNGNSPAVAMRQSEVMLSKELPNYSDELNKFKTDISNLRTTRERAELARMRGEALSRRIATLQVSDPQEYRAAALELLETIAFYSVSSTDSIRLHDLANRIPLTDQQISAVYGALIATRDFDLASHWAKRFPKAQLEKLPTINRAPHQVALSIWEISSDSASIQQVAWQMPKGSSWVVITHPNCAFSRAAMKEITDDKLLREKMFPSALWLAPPDEKLRLTALSSWNQSNQDIKIRLAHSIDEWPPLVDWSTPSFYLFEDGKLKASFQGWPKDGSARKRLLDAH